MVLQSESDAELYSNEISKHNKKFHLIIVDGIFRNESLTKSLNYLTEDGIIVFDDTERKEYKISFQILSDNGFNRLDFRGMRGITSIINTTSVFYRKNNCLNI